MLSVNKLQSSKTSAFTRAMNSLKSPDKLLSEFSNLPSDSIQTKIDHFYLPYTPELER